MKIYFAATDEEIKRQEAETIFNVSDNTIMYFTVRESFIDLVKDIEEYINQTSQFKGVEPYKTYNVIEANVSEKDLIGGFRAALCGDVIRNIAVEIKKITKIDLVKEN